MKQVFSLLFFYSSIVFAVVIINACKGAAGSSCSTIGFLKSATKNKAAQLLQRSPASGCDSSIWNHVYDPDRLQVLHECIEATGTITERNADEDGDEHMLLKLDKGQKDLLRKKNYTKKEGCLVVEVVCVNNITRKRAKGACDGYVNNVQLPNVGDHVRVTGSYVNDSHNGWTEIHPVSKIEKLK